MKHLLLTGLFLLLARPALAEAPVLFFQGQFRQGEMLIGYVTPGSKLTVNGEKIHIRPDGWFMYGIGRDEKGKLTFTAQKKKEKTVRTYDVQPRKWNIQRVDGLPQNTVTPNKEEQERIEKEAVITQEARDTFITMPVPLCFSMPAQGRISSVYGSQRIMNGVPGAAHNALDIANKTGTPIVAPADGVVLLVYDEMLLSGKTILLGHGQDVTTSYIHLSDIAVKTGQQVKKGDKLGAIGMTGRATGPHLHWTVMWKHKRVDPQPFLENSAKFCPAAPAKKASAAKPAKPAKKAAKKVNAAKAKKADSAKTSKAKPAKAKTTKAEPQKKSK